MTITILGDGTVTTGAQLERDGLSFFPNSPSMEIAPSTELAVREHMWLTLLKK